MRQYASRISVYQNARSTDCVSQLTVPWLARITVLAVYETPGTWDFAKTVLPHVKNANTVILANHGTVSWDTQSVERAFWYT
ncbi:MAG: class II aldolase/adducin family protein, partial [Planctomycetota bacterium]